MGKVYCNTLTVLQLKRGLKGWNCIAIHCCVLQRAGGRIVLQPGEELYYETIECIVTRVYCNTGRLGAGVYCNIVGQPVL